MDFLSCTTVRIAGRIEIAERGPTHRPDQSLLARFSNEADGGRFIRGHIIDARPSKLLLKWKPQPDSAIGRALLRAATDAAKIAFVGEYGFPRQPATRTPFLELDLEEFEAARTQLSALKQVVDEGNADQIGRAFNSIGIRSKATVAIVADDGQLAQTISTPDIVSFCAYELLICKMRGKIASKCRQCGDAIPSDKRADSAFCSSRCRVAHHRSRSAKSDRPGF